MTITERLRLELLVREQIHKYGNDFYTELAKILERVQAEDQQQEAVPPVSRFRVGI